MISHWNEPRREYAKSCARAIIRELELREPADIEIDLIAAYRGAIVTETDMEGCDGRLICRGKSGFIEVRRRIAEPNKKRFVAAHELGHFEIHDGHDQSACYLDKRLHYFYSRVEPEEEDANEFACELLMPEELFKPRCTKFTPCIEGIDSVAQEFRTSLTATAMRYVTFSPYCCALICTEQGTRKPYRTSEEFPFRIARGALDPRSHAFGFGEGAPNPRKMQQTIASAWLEPQGIERIKCIREESRVLSRYGKILTLLWMELEDDYEYGYECEEEEEILPSLAWRRRHDEGRFGR